LSTQSVFLNEFALETGREGLDVFDGLGYTTCRGRKWEYT
jgi:hypothetical protein